MVGHTYICFFIVDPPALEFVKLFTVNDVHLPALEGIVVGSHAFAVDRIERVAAVFEVGLRIAFKLANVGGCEVVFFNYHQEALSRRGSCGTGNETTIGCNVSCLQHRFARPTSGCR